MSSPSQIDKKPIAGKEELVAWFETGCTPAKKLLIGIEHEKPPFYLADGAPVPYAGENGRAGMADFIQGMANNGNGWQIGNIENGLPIDLVKDNLSWTFEPGLQMETGGAPLKNCHQIAKETDEVLAEGVQTAKALGFGMLAQGFHPTVKGDHMPMMPKSRYRMMHEFVDAKGMLNGVDLLSCTSTVQVNLGYQSEEDMVKMLRVSLALQPVVVALFANSPFYEGKLSGYQSTRSITLYNKLGGRCGFTLPIAFDPGFGFEMFTDFALDNIAMLGLYKDNIFMDAKGGKFIDFINGTLKIAPGQKATMSDWQNHLNTIWPEVRLRRFLEMRGADNGPAEMIKALPAFWTGILYDKTALDHAYEMIKDWTQQDREYLRIMTPMHGLQTPFLNTTVQELAKNCLAISEAGLKRRNILNKKGQDESCYLEPLHEIAASGLNWALRIEDMYKNSWNHDISQIFNAMNYENNPSVLKKAEPKPMPGSIDPGKKLKP